MEIAFILIVLILISIYLVYLAFKIISDTFSKDKKMMEKTNNISKKARLFHKEKHLTPQQLSSFQ
jgi:threonine/homoserine/homoserine lactone efflux protein